MKEGSVTVQRKLAIGLAGSTLLLALGALAAEGVIGQAISQGSMDVDHAQAAGIAPLSSGSVVKTGAAPGRIVLQNGVRGALGPASQAEIYQDRLVLQSGHATVSAGQGYRVEVGGYTITPARGARANVEMQQGAIAVGAAGAPVSVTDGTGVLLARVDPGTALSFEPAGELASRLTGTVERAGDQFYLTDELTHVRVELRGKDLAGQVGHRVGVMGTPKGTPDHQFLDVAQATRLSDAPVSPGAAKAATGVSHGTKIGLAVVGGAVAAAGATLGTISR